jgi:A/G-specific adenine glycosylase
MGRRTRKPDSIARIRHELLEWYDGNRRDLPWRSTEDPYAIWVSEIMLQQTRVAAVIERYVAFMTRFPTLIVLAAASEEDVLALWSGLGYYRRARLLHKAAQFVVDDLNGNMPASAEALRSLPGIGSYTSAAIASIAYGERVAVVDGNVVRVLCRLQGWDATDRAGEAVLRRKVEDAAAATLDPKRPGDFNQALMELGATVCLPRNPQCLACPLAPDCRTLGEHKTMPRRPMSSTEVACALAVRAGRRRGLANREVLLEQRPASNTVMPKMWELPVLREADLPEAELRMTVRHAIMQVNYVVRVRTVSMDDVAAMAKAEGERRWVPISEAAAMALTGLARKVLTRAGLLPGAAKDALPSRPPRKYSVVSRQPGNSAPDFADV